MPKDRKRKNMLIIACIMLFATLFTLVPAFSFSVTAARMNAGSVAEDSWIFNGIPRGAECY